MPLYPYLNFDGQTREAATYYARVFETEEPKFMTYGEMPEDPGFPMPEAVKNLIMHTRITVSGTPLMFSDVFPGMELVHGNNVNLTVITPDRDELERWFNTLAEEGKIQMPLEETSWSKAYGQVTDKYGVDWQFNLDSGETY